jgi:hypothetical protein
MTADRSTLVRRLQTLAYEIKLIDKDVNYAHGIGVRHVVIERFREEKALRTIVALNKPLHLAHPIAIGWQILALQNAF